MEALADTQSRGSNMQIQLRSAQFRAASAHALALATLFAMMCMVAQAAAPSVDASTILGPAAPNNAYLSCGPGAAGLAKRSVDRIEKSLLLTDLQMAKLNELKAASDKAVQYLNENCPPNDPVTPTGRVDVVERRLEAMLAAVRILKPALEEFYGSLSDEQKARLIVFEPARPNTSARRAASPDAGVRPVASNDVESKPGPNSDDGTGPVGNAGTDEPAPAHRYRHHVHHYARPHWRFHFPFPFPLPF
jgi:hypothetical protein